MSQVYRGAIVEESLLSQTALHDFRVLETTVTDDPDPADRWTIRTVEATREQVEKLADALKPRGWYAHFWDESRNILAVFPGGVFAFAEGDTATRQRAIDFGLSLSIPREQLDFLID